ncbi:MAG: hypothetical protein RBG13Loki_2937 [Promethearchaeota archaeon CR_4]|nr:MAG: hypothetical protein RBG13Loki_2937 [Candidatus Lokiarchaeota archaeon CR_4]
MEVWHQNKIHRVGQGYFYPEVGGDEKYYCGYEEEIPNECNLSSVLFNPRYPAFHLYSVLRFQI